MKNKGPLNSINFLAVQKRASGKHIGITLYVIQIILYTRIRWRSYQLYQANIAPNTAAIADVSFSLPRTKNKSVRFGRRP